MAKVLVIDDNADNRALIVALLESRGHRSLEAADGAQALEIARREHPSLVISDVLMPVMDGYEFVRHLRADPEIAGTRVIFCTAHYSEREARSLAQAAGVMRVLAKPCEPQDVLAAIDEALTAEPATGRTVPAASFDRAHLRLMTDKLSEKVELLQAANLRLQEEILERRRAEQKTRHLNRVHAVLSGINSLIVRVKTRAELFQEACRLAVEQGGMLLAWIGEVDANGREIQPSAWAGADDSFVKGNRISTAAAFVRQRSLAAAAIGTGQPAVCNDIGREIDSLLYGAEMLERGYRSAAVLPLLLDGKAVGCLGLHTGENEFFDAAEMRLLNELAGDISFALDHIAKAERLDYLAYYDALTGIANRTLFHERLTQYLSAAARHGRKLALVIAELERFADVGDNYGRHVADQLLKQLAVRLAQCVDDPAQIARTGVNQFAAVMPDVSDEGEILRTAADWGRRIFGKPFAVTDLELKVPSHAGIAVFPADGADADALLRNAEAALRNTRESGERFLFYTPQMGERIGEKIALESQLRRALERREFVLHYQLKVDLDTRRIEGAEALIRWQSPQLGLVPPASFIPLLEETGLIAEVGAWALSQAARDRQMWIARRLKAPRIAVNVSPVQLRRTDFVRTVTDALELEESAPGLDIEVTESLLMEDIDDHMKKLKEIQDLGVAIAIDDFGTGYSSLGYLTRLPVDALKIDRSFVSAMLDDPGAMTLVSTIISLAHALKLRVVAEGVESEEQAKILRLLRCDQMQGYLVGRPLDPEAMADLLEHVPERR